MSRKLVILERDIDVVEFLREQFGQRDYVPEQWLVDAVRTAFNLGRFYQDNEAGWGY